MKGAPVIAGLVATRVAFLPEQGPFARIAAACNNWQSLTPKRKAMGKACIQEALRKSNNDRAEARKLIIHAIDAFVEYGAWHREYGHEQWEAVFGSIEKFERCLEWHDNPPAPLKKVSRL